MKKTLLLSILTLAAGSLIAADSSPLETVITAATALGNQANYSWHSAQESPDGKTQKAHARMYSSPPRSPRIGATEGKTQKDGYTWISMDMMGNVTEAFLQGTNAAIKSSDAGWQSRAEARADNGGGGFPAAKFTADSALSNKIPSVEVMNLVTKVKELKKDGDTFSGDLTEESVKAMMTFGPRNGRGALPAATITGGKISVKFWIADGKLTKYQTHLAGLGNINGNAHDIDQTTTVEIKDVGTTKLEVPDAAMAKLQ